MNGNGVVQILEKTNGAKFYWADLHIHTPAWPNFKLPSGVDTSDEDWRREFAAEYIKKAQERGITILGITEHNDVSWVDYIRDAAMETNIKIFPGFEITTQSGADGIHILCLFNLDSSKEILDGLLSNLGLLPGQRFHPDGGPKAVMKDMKEIISTVKNQGGICIAAHMCRDNGLLSKSKGQIRIDLFTDPNLLAGEIPAGRDSLGNFEKRAVSNELDFYKRKFPIACMNSSDAKSIDEIGSKKTFIKISSFTVEGLREAFLDWQSRIRLVNEFPPTAPNFSKILAAKWEGGFLNDIGIHFNDNLNCIIGGKGTGKSTIIETFRYAFDEKAKIEKINELHNEILKEVFRSGSKVSIFIESHQPIPRKYIIERTYPELPVVKEENGIIRSDLKPLDIFQIEIYGQKEIYEISKDRQFQFAILNRFVGNKIDSLKDGQKDILKELAESKSNLIQLQINISSFEEQISILPSLVEKIKAYRTMGFDKILKEKMEYSKEDGLLQQGLKKLEKFSEQFENFKKKIDLETTFLLNEETKELPNKKLIEEAARIITALSKSINNNFTEIESALTDAIEKYKGEKGVLSKWQELNRRQNERYGSILRELQKKFKNVDPSEFIQLEQRISQLRSLKKEKSKNDEQYRELETDRNDLLIRLQENRSQMYRIRQEVMNELNRKLTGAVKVILEHQGEKQKFVKKLKSFKSSVREEQLNRIVESSNFSIIEFCRLIRNGPENLAEKYEIPPASAQALCKAIAGEELYDLETFEIPTKVFIELNLGSKESPNFKNIEHLSIGQKCTALLTLILLENPFPLIVDQPEDDLDNSFIVNDIVNRLRQEKENRQFIIATHNANIPVLGDAELIIPLEATVNLARIEEGFYGSIDDEPVKEIVKKTLEGGKVAFEIRKQKYGI